MLFEKTKIEGLWVVNTVPVRDSRGSFARTFCKREFESNALVSDFSQHSLSLSKLKHTVRGLHFQRPPHGEKVKKILPGLGKPQMGRYNAASFP